MFYLKRYFFVLLFAFLFSFPCSSQDFSPPVMDYGDILSDSEEIALKSVIQRLTSETNFSFGIITYNEKPNYSSLLSHLKNTVGPTHFTENRFLLAVNLYSREFVLEINGYSAQSKVDNLAMNSILDKILPYFTAGDYSDGCQYFLSLTESYITGEISGQEKIARLQENSGFFVFTFFFALLTAGGVTYYFVYSMNNVREQPHAGDYLDRTAFTITQDREQFLYRNTVKTPKQSHSSGSGRGGRGGGHSGGGSRRF